MIAAQCVEVMQRVPTRTFCPTPLAPSPPNAPFPVCAPHCLQGSTRNIASGLRAFYTLEEMQGRRVMVLANLKPRNIGGFKSNGMVSSGKTTRSWHQLLCLFVFWFPLVFGIA